MQWLSHYVKQILNILLITRYNIKAVLHTPSETAIADK